MARTALWFLVLLLGATSCSFYKRDILFRTDGMPDSLLIKSRANLRTVNYKINKYDWLDIRVSSNGGENLIDPNAEFGRQVGGNANGMISGGGGQGAMGGNGAVNLFLIGTTNPGRYLVEDDGHARLPLIGKVKVGGLTYRQADSLLSEKYSNFYEDAFVVTRAANRRAVVYLGNASGLNLAAGLGAARTISLTDEGISVFEAIALAGGVPAYSDMSNVRIIRGGDMSLAKVEVVNLQFVNTMKQADLRIFPNDIVYIEPARRPGIDLIRDISPIVTLPLSLFTAIYLLTLPR